ncbi:MAG: efflux RND transporter periplasmic adaptor subunit, partial [Candidatus Eremiobacterota bacterium]
GDRVEAGQPLVMLDSRDLSAQVGQAQAQVMVARAQLQQSVTSVGLTGAEVDTGVKTAEQQLVQARAAESKAVAELEDARLNVERERMLFAQDAVPKIQVEQAELRWKLAQRTLEGARSQVKIAADNVRLARANLARRNLSQDQVTSARAGVSQAEAGLTVAAVMHDYTVITSPIGGVVTDRSVDPGQTVGPGSDPMLVIVDNRVLELRTTAAEQYAPDLKPGLTVEIRTDLFPDRKFTGRVRQVVPSANPATHAVDLLVDVNDRGFRLFDGLYVEGQVEVRKHSGVLVPRMAVQRRQSETYVMVLEGDTVRKTPVSVSFESETEAVVTGDLSAGREVITAGAEGLEDKQKVQVAP